MSNGILIALVGFLGAIVGGALQAAFQRVHSRIEHLRRERTDAFLIFFRGVAGLSHARTDAEVSVSNALVAEGRARAALYADAAVLKAMTEAFRKGPISNSDMSTHAKMIRAMRSDASHSSDEVSDEVLFEMLYGSRGD